MEDEKKIGQDSRTGRVLVDSKYFGGERLDTQQLERGYECIATVAIMLTVT